MTVVKRVPVPAESLEFAILVDWRKDEQTMFTSCP
jgi:hypothetical protein